MGSSESKNILENRTSSNKNDSKPMAITAKQIVSEKDIHLEFIKLYVHSRTALHVAIETPNEMLHHNIGQNNLMWNSKTFDECCNKIEAYSKGIVDLVNERLGTFSENNYRIPNTDSESIDSYINSRNSAHCDAAKPLPPNHVHGSGTQTNGSLATGADVM